MFSPVYQTAFVELMRALGLYYVFNQLVQADCALACILVVLHLYIRKAKLSIPLLTNYSDSGPVLELGDLL